MDNYPAKYSIFYERFEYVQAISRSEFLDTICLSIVWEKSRFVKDKGDEFFFPPGSSILEGGLN